MTIPPPPTEPPPTAWMPAPPAPRRRRGATVVGVVLIAVAVVAVIAVLSVHRSSSPKTPQAVTDAYYRALAKDDASGAYALLCTQQQMGSSDWSARVKADEQTGTGIKSWSRQGSSVVRGDEAVVAGTVRLDDGTSTPIQVLLLRQNDAWGVCTSNLGGVLPSPGTSGGTGGSGGSGGSGGGTPT